MDEIVAQHFLELINEYNKKSFAISAEELQASYQKLQNQLHPEPEIEPATKTVFNTVINSVYTFLFVGILIGTGVGLSLFFLLSAPVVVSVLVGGIVGGLIGRSVYSSFFHETPNNPKNSIDKLEKNHHSVWNSQLNKSVKETYKELEHAVFFLNNK